MGIEIILIVGDSNAGKSTLVRCLTGKSRDSHRHLNASKNILSLEWKSQNKEIPTLVLISSLNEGDSYRWTSFGQYVRPNGVVKIHPKDFAHFLDGYERHGARKAILCISSGELASGWQLADYLSEIKSWPNNSHKVTHTIEMNGVLVGRGLGVIVKVPGPRLAANSVAAIARNGLPLH